MAAGATRRQRSAHRRAAWHADRLRAARGPLERYRAAEAWLLSAVAHARSWQLAAREAACDIAGHARRVLERAELPRASRQLHETKLAGGRDELGHLANALMVLRSAIRHLPDTERDRLADHYAVELAREAREISGRR